MNRTTTKTLVLTRVAVTSIRGQRLPNRENGAVLIISMVILLVLTLIGVAGLTNTALEEKMSSNTQEVHRAFQAAETGISVTVKTPDAFDLDHDVGNPKALPSADLGTQGEKYASDTGFQSWSIPPVGSGYSAVHFQTANFEIESVGESRGGARKELIAGAYQVAPKAN